MAVSTRQLPTQAERLLAHVRLPMYRNAYSLVLSSATTSGLGVVYWTLAARVYSPEAVGLNAAAISAMMFLAGVAQLNLMSALVRFIPNAGARTQRLIVSAYLLSMLLALGASLAFLAGADRWAPNLRFLASSPLSLAWFTAATMGWCIFVLQDSAMTGLRQATWVLVENASFAVVKIGLLVGLAVLTPDYGVFASWTIGFALCLLPTNYLIFRHLVPNHVRTRADSAQPLALGPVVRYVTTDNLGSLCWLASTTLLPVLVVQQAGAPANAYFYLAWQVAYALHLVSSSMASSLVAEASADQRHLRTYTLRLLRQTARIVVPLVVLTVLAAPLILSIFGEAYVAEATPLLRLLALGAIPNIVTALFIGAARVRRRMRLVVGLLAPFAALVLSLTYVLLHVFGLTGVGLAWLLAQTIAAGYIILRGARLLEAPDPPAVGAFTRGWLRLPRLGASWDARRRLARALTLVGGPLPRLVAVVVLWVVSLSGVDASRMNDLGLVSVLSWPSAAALALLCISFGLLVRRPRAHQPLLLLHVLVLIGLLHATPSVLYGTLRYSWAWKHVGIVDYIQRHGSVDPTISALNVYHNWPGFFVLSALATEGAGLPSALSFASWAPPVFNALFALGVGFVARAFTRDARLIWLTVWFFCLTNWIGQDYFSPQAMNYFLYLVALGICLRWLQSSGVPAPAELRRWLRVERAVTPLRALLDRAAASRPPGEAVGPGQRAGLVAVVVLLAAVVASSHQLTPFMLLLAVTALVVFQQCRARGLPLLVLVLTVAWIVYMAVGFLDGNLYWIVRSVGRLLNNVNATLIDLSVASPGQRFIALIDRSLSAGVGVLALVGLLRRLRQGYWDLSCALLTVSPLPMLAGNAYGGEILFRIYFFALPFMAFFAAAIIYPSAQSRASWRTSALAIVLSCALVAGFCVAYWGKDRMYHFSPAEVQATDYLDSVAPEDTLLVDGTWNYPWPPENYERYTHLTLSLIRPNERTGLYDDTATYVASLLQNGHHEAAYLFITRSQKAETEMTGVLPVGTLDMVEDAVSRSPRFKTIFSNADARIFTLAETQP